MTETNINLGCAKINIKRDTKNYAPWHVINPRLINPIPAGAKTYKLSPSTTLFFKRTRCDELKFGWRKIKIKPIQKEGKNMSYNYMSTGNVQDMGRGNSQDMSRGNVQDNNFSEREYAAVERTFRGRHTLSRDKRREKKLALLHENRVARKAMSFWQKTAVFLAEADYDMSRFFENDKSFYGNCYRHGTPGDKLTASFLKQNKEDKKAMSFLQQTAVLCVDAPATMLWALGFLEDDDPTPNHPFKPKSNVAYGLASFFQEKNMKTKKIKKIKKPNSVRKNVHNMTVAIRRRNVQPSAPALSQPAYNPEHQGSTTINNYHITICSIL